MGGQTTSGPPLDPQQDQQQTQQARAQAALMQSATGQPLPPDVAALLRQWGPVLTGTTPGTGGTQG